MTPQQVVDLQRVHADALMTLALEYQKAVAAEHLRYRTELAGLMTLAQAKAPPRPADAHAEGGTDD